MVILAHIEQKPTNSLPQQIRILHKSKKNIFFFCELLAFWKVCSFTVYVLSILGRGSFCFNYCLNSALHGGYQFVALLRWYGSPGFFDRGLQLICIFWSLVSNFPLDNISMGFKSGEFAVQSSTPTPWSYNQLLVLLAVWAGAKSCWKMKAVSLKSWSAEGSMKYSNVLVNVCSDVGLQKNKIDQHSR